MSTPVLRLQPPNQWELGALSPVMKEQKCEADITPPSSAAVMNIQALQLLPYMPSWNCA